MRWLTIALAAFLLAAPAGAGTRFEPLTTKCAAIPFDPTATANPIEEAFTLGYIGYWVLGLVNGHYAATVKTDAGATAKDVQRLLTYMQAYCEAHPEAVAYVAGLFAVNQVQRR